jgi:hypothetical protein
MMQTIRSEITSVVHRLPWLVAQDEGLFAEEGLNAELVHASQRGTWKTRGGSEPGTISGRDLVRDHRVVDSIGI